MNPTLTTKRLQLPPCQRSDVAFLHSLWISDRIRDFLFDDRIISLEEANAFVDSSIDSFEQHGYGLWLVQLLDQGIGFAGLLCAAAAPTLLYGIQPDYWGQGYATEAARAILDYSLQTLNLPEVNADVDEPNTASIQVLHKLGMKQVNRAIVNDRPLLYFTSLLD